jgi:hypothetical protein
MCAVEDVEDGICSDVVASFVDAPGFQVLGGVGKAGHQILHPLGVNLQRFEIGQWLDLRVEIGIWRAPSGADFSALVSFAGVEEGPSQSLSSSTSCTNPS